ncbi:MAG: hypothetical protein JWR56_2995 [Massilia sp.]|nr:hypothetical protein [Massilia sp.]
MVDQKKVGLVDYSMATSGSDPRSVRRRFLNVAYSSSTLDLSPIIELEKCITSPSSRRATRRRTSSIVARRFAPTRACGTAASLHTGNAGYC